MNNSKVLEGSMTNQKLWRVRLSVAMIIGLLMTFLAPISSQQIPPGGLEIADAMPVSLHEYAAFTSYLQYGWTDKEFKCLDNIWTQESHWNPKAKNGKSTAFGIAQKLNETSPNGLLQIRHGLRYINLRYKNPCNAWLFWKRNYWY